MSGHTRLLFAVKVALLDVMLGDSSSCEVVDEIATLLFAVVAEDVEKVVLVFSREISELSLMDNDDEVESE